MRRFWSLLAGLIPILSGCHHPAEDGNDQGTSLAVAVPTEDAAIEDATKEARKSLDKFITQLTHPKSGQSDFSIKVPVRTEEGTHYLWLQEVTYDGANFSGVLGQDAAGIDGHAPGEPVSIASREIADWMYLENEVLVGGFSLRAIRDRLAGRARTQFEKSMWFRFE